MRKSGWLAACVLLAATIVSAQTPTEKWDVPEPQSFGFVHKNLNKINHASSLKPVLEKLYQEKKNHKGVIRIVHIGDSHLQADMITSILRHGFQDYFGNSGRGMVFPYQLAKSNAPSDIKSSSNVVWLYNRLAHPEIFLVNGISGFGIHTNQPKANINLYLRPKDTAETELFDRMRFFTSTDSVCYTVTFPGLEDIVTARSAKMDTPSFTVKAPQPVAAFSLSKCDDNNKSDFDFYGVSLEKTNTPGVIYSSIGVNGAQFYQFTNTPLFWQQLPALRADCYIISLGTNEAQRLNITEADFEAEVDSFVAKIKIVSPQAVIMFTTPAGSYYKMKKPNAVIKRVSDALVSYCAENKYPCWDLYKISNGLAGTASWKKNKLMSHDLVHYNGQGYQLQGQLLLQALADVYNEYAAKKKDK